MTTIQKISFAAFLLATPLFAHAGGPIAAPEIDGGGLLLALGIMVASVALLRDKFKK